MLNDQPTRLDSMSMAGAPRMLAPMPAVVMSAYTDEAFSRPYRRVITTGMQGQNAGVQKNAAAEPIKLTAGDASACAHRPKLNIDATEAAASVYVAGKLPAREPHSTRQ